MQNNDKLKCYYDLRQTAFYTTFLLSIISLSLLVHAIQKNICTIINAFCIKYFASNAFSKVFAVKFIFY